MKRDVCNCRSDYYDVSVDIVTKRVFGNSTTILQYLFSSPVATASIVAILLQAILPNVQEG